MRIKTEEIRLISEVSIVKCTYDITRQQRYRINKRIYLNLRDISPCNARRYPVIKRNNNIENEEDEGGEGEGKEDDCDDDDDDNNEEEDKEVSS